MIWIILFFIIILISAVLAYRSMRDYEEFPDSASLNSAFFVGHPQNFTIETLKKLHEIFLNQKQFFSLERLYKGKDKVLVIFGSRELVKYLPELNLVELEDYLVSSVLPLSDEEFEKKVSPDQSLSWLVEPKNNPKKDIHINPELKNFTINDNQRFFIQVVCMPFKNSSGDVFQTTIRVMVCDRDPINRVNLAKNIDQVFTSATGLHKHTDDFPEIKKFDSYKQRTLIPKEVAQFPMTGREVYEILV